MAGVDRRVILAALARGDGQLMHGFDLEHTAEIMYGGQADAIELLIASAKREALKEAAATLQAENRLLHGLPGDRIRRQTMEHAATVLRAIGKRITVVAQARYYERRQAARPQVPAIDNVAMEGEG